MSDPVQLRTAQPVPGCVVLSVLGEIDLVTAGELEAGIAEQLSGTPRLVVDLSGVTFFGSLGLATLIRAAEVADDREVRFALVPGPLVLRTMELTRTVEHFTLHDTVADALR